MPNYESAATLFDDNTDVLLNAGNPDLRTPEQARELLAEHEREKLALKEVITAQSYIRGIGNAVSGYRAYEIDSTISLN